MRNKETNSNSSNQEEVTERDRLRNKRNYGLISKEQPIKLATSPKANFLPDISINDKILPSKVFAGPSKCDLKEESMTFQLPHLSSQCEVQMKREKADDKNIDKIISDKNESIPNTEIFHQKHILEESLKESLRPSDVPKYYLEGETKSTRHLMLEINEFYLEMAEQLRLLKGNLLNNAQNRVKEINEKDTTSTYEIEVIKLIKSIEEVDERVAENVKILEDMRQERRSLQGDTEYPSEESKMFDKQNDNDEHLRKQNNNEVFANDASNSKNNKNRNGVSDRKNFVVKNKELAKEYNASKYCLTDEEKVKLQSLLSDIDVQEEGYEESDQQVKQHNEDPESTNITTTESIREAFHDENKDNNQFNPLMYLNGFKFECNETELLNNLEVKILNLQQAQMQDKTCSAIDTYNDLKMAESKGKHWKFPLLQKRLRKIERKLAEIQVEKKKENEEEDESANLKTENRVDMEKEYQRSVYEISVDIGEIEYEANREIETEVN